MWSFVCREILSELLHEYILFRLLLLKGLDCVGILFVCVRVVFFFLFRLEVEKEKGGEWEGIVGRGGRLYWALFFF